LLISRAGGTLSTVTELLPGDVVADRYEVERYLGSGGMGTVWAVRDRERNVSRAIKLLRRTEPEARRRFVREIDVMRELRHPNLVTLHGVLDLESGPALVMELLQGGTLRARLDRSPSIELGESCRVLSQVASALAAAHAIGVVHRDVKPENIFLENEGGGVKLLDFGVAKLLEPEATGALRTELGTLLGTLCYMAPEQALGLGDIDERADAWALGVVLYEALSGCRPIEGDTPNRFVRRLLTGAILPLRELCPNLPPELDDLARWLLIRARDERCGSLLEVERVLALYAA
jgi:eukaryotic-like serine/threonine-protein kinase